MSNLRQDPLTGRTVIIAENRAARPYEYERQPVRRIASTCPFCAGHEVETPGTIATYRQIGAPTKHWDVRVVPNKYPAIQHEDVANTDSKGVHEIIVESSEHRATISQLSDEHLQLVLRAYRDRILALAQRGDLAYALLFKNSGPIAGASLEHVHSQLIGLPIVPRHLVCELDRARTHHQSQGECILCAVIDREISQRERIVTQSSRFVAYCPYASRFSHEVWIAPRQHASRFETTDDDQIGELAKLLRDVLRRVEISLEQFSYNVLVRTAPFDISHEDYYHWRIEIFPRLNSIAGFELGSECFINPTYPENAANHLRNARL